MEVSYWTKGDLTLPSSVVQMTWRKKARKKIQDSVIQHLQIVGRLLEEQYIIDGKSENRFPAQVVRFYLIYTLISNFQITKKIAIISIIIVYIYK